MKDKAFVETARLQCERQVKELTDKGAPAAPTTILEKHAYQLGRLDALKWVLGGEGE